MQLKADASSLWRLRPTVPLSEPERRDCREICEDRLLRSFGLTLARSHTTLFNLQPSQVPLTSQYQCDITLIYKEGTNANHGGRKGNPRRLGLVGVVSYQRDSDPLHHRDQQFDGAWRGPASDRRSAFAARADGGESQHSKGCNPVRQI